MRLRPATTSLLLLVAPIIVSALVTPPSSNQAVVREAAVQDYKKPLESLSPRPAVSKDDVGTKDAPVDGLDGKPHKGPFVESPTEKLSQTVEDLGEKKKPIKGVDPVKGVDVIEEDGVMNDRNRVAPKEGTTGTEGGVSEKERDRKTQEKETGEKAEKKPEQPKEAPESPHSEQEKVKELAKGKSTAKSSDDDLAAEKPLGAAGIEKPDDLPNKPHDIPHPDPPTMPSETSGNGFPVKSSKDFTDKIEEEGVIQPLHSLVLSFTMILVSEIGDKTFLVAALMAMRHPRLVVFSGAFAALIAMTVLSAVLGHTVPTLLPKRFTAFAAAVLFLIFGAKLLREGLAMSPDEGVGEEMKEVEAELEEKESLAARHSRRRRSSATSPYNLEAGRGRGLRSKTNSTLPALARSPSSSPSRSPSPKGASLSGAVSGLNNLFSLLLSPAWVQTFVMTFLGEWGDRSQIATIAMAAGQDYWWVTGGAISGHAICTGVAVIGGRAIAGRVSMRVVTLGGAIAFLIFGVIYLAEAIYSGGGAA